jgi:transcriptional regulator with XRE-family HTH domain
VSSTESRRCVTCGTVIESTGRTGRPPKFCRDHRGSRRSIDGPFGALLRQAVKQHGLSSRQIADDVRRRFGDSLATSHATLSEWQRGKRLPRRTARDACRVVAVELELGLGIGDLLLQLPEDPVVGPWPASTCKETSTGPAATHAARRAAFLNETHRAWGDDINDLQMLVVSVRKEYLFAPSGRPHSMPVTLEMRAIRESAQRYIFVHAFDPELRPRVTGLSECVARREFVDPAGPLADGHLLCATEILLPKPLGRGELGMLIFLVRYDGLRDPQFRHAFNQPIKQLDLALQFDGRRPRRVIECRWRYDDLSEIDAAPAAGKHGRYLLSKPTPTPGAYGWRWDC